MSRDHRDLALEQLADDEAEQREMLVDLTLARDAYRELAQQAIHALRNLTRDRDRQREQHARVVDEYRHLRERTMRAAAAA